MNAPELSDRSQWAAVQRSMIQLQKCMSALEKIRAIAGVGSPIDKIALDAMTDKPWAAGGLDG